MGPFQHVQVKSSNIFDNYVSTFLKYLPATVDLVQQPVVADDKQSVHQTVMRQYGTVKSYENDFLASTHLTASLTIVFTVPSTRSQCACES